MINPRKAIGHVQPTHLIRFSRSASNHYTPSSCPPIYINDKGRRTVRTVQDSTSRKECLGDWKSLTRKTYRHVLSIRWGAVSVLYCTDLYRTATACTTVLLFGKRCACATTNLPPTSHRTKQKKGCWVFKMLTTDQWENGERASERRPHLFIYGIVR